MHKYKTGDKVFLVKSRCNYFNNIGWDFYDKEIIPVTIKDAGYSNSVGHSQETYYIEETNGVSFLEYHFVKDISDYRPMFELKLKFNIQLQNLINNIIDLQK